MACVIRSVTNMDVISNMSSVGKTELVMKYTLKIKQINPFMAILVVIVMIDV